MHMHVKTLRAVNRIATPYAQITYVENLLYFDMQVMHLMHNWFAVLWQRARLSSLSLPLPTTPQLTTHSARTPHLYIKHLSRQKVSPSEKFSAITHISRARSGRCIAATSGPASTQKPEAKAEENADWTKLLLLNDRPLTAY